MKSTLTVNQREYVLFHLNNIFELSSEIRKRMVFSEINDGYICFSQSSKGFDEDSVLWLDELPVLFSDSSDSPIYTFENGTLIFHHDLLKSAFYLLSGYQEYKSFQKDTLGRFPYEGSIQSKLKIIHRPVVNEYFELIADAIMVYCRYHKIFFNKRKLFKSFGLFLTHDVDRIDKYSVHTVKGKIKKDSIKKGIQWAFRWLNPFYRENPYWSYDYLNRIEDKLGIKSCYYFLNKDVKHEDSYYKFSNTRIRKLIVTLAKREKEIGLHGGVRSFNDSVMIKKNLRELQEVNRNIIMGNRQHRLIFNLPQTMKYLFDNNIYYDSSLGFAAHEGFRNSYCLPFKLFDFEQDKMINVWEIPLNIMDGTLFNYRNLSFDEARDSIMSLVKTVHKYHGVITLLFHPDFVDEEERPGVRVFYENILTMIMKENAQSVTGLEILELLGDINVH